MESLRSTIEVKLREDAVHRVRNEKNLLEFLPGSMTYNEHVVRLFVDRA
jgi:hypothetical protein